MQETTIFQITKDNFATDLNKCAERLCQTRRSTCVLAKLCSKNEKHSQSQWWSLFLCSEFWPRLPQDLRNLRFVPTHRSHGRNRTLVLLNQLRNMQWLFCFWAETQRKAEYHDVNVSLEDLVDSNFKNWPRNIIHTSNSVWMRCFVTNSETKFFDSLDVNSNSNWIYRESAYENVNDFLGDKFTL